VPTLVGHSKFLTDVVCQPVKFRQAWGDCQLQPELPSQHILHRGLLGVNCFFVTGIVVLKGTTEATFDRCSFLKNLVDFSQGGPIFATEDATVVVRNSSFERNVAW
jgi:hypothetical protein